MRTSYLFRTAVIIACLACQGCWTPPPPPEEAEEVTVPLPPRGPGVEEVTVPLSPRGPGVHGIPGSSGQVTYRTTSSKSFKATVTLRGLKKSYVYVLALEGKKGKDGNEELKQVGEDQSGVGLVDVWIPDESPTDPNGNWKGEFPFVSLIPHMYHVKFLVKDPLDTGWTTVLHHDNLRFRITE